MGYAAQPCETVNYVSAHDNETLFDGITLRSAPDVPIATRCRINRLAVATVALSQGVPFFHAGDEILRSKSLDRDSYNSGDWFNRLDYTFETHNFGVGLPGREKNGDRYPFIEGLLADASLRPDAALIAQSAAHFREVLAIRQSTPLFRLTDAEEVQKRVTFYNTGVAQTPGVVVMGVSDDAADGVARACERPASTWRSTAAKKARATRGRRTKTRGRVRSRRSRRCVERRETRRRGRAAERWTRCDGC